MAIRPGSATLGKIEDAVFKEGVSAFQEWRKKSKNGILPIGICAVGKTTLLSKFDVAIQSSLQANIQSFQTSLTTVAKAIGRTEIVNVIEQIQISIKESPELKWLSFWS